MNSQLENSNEPRYLCLQREAALEAAAREKLLQKKDALRKQLEIQLEEAVARKLRGEPAMTKTEREINADMLRRMHASEIASASTRIQT